MILLLEGTWARVLPTSPLNAQPYRRTKRYPRCPTPLQLSRPQIPQHPPELSSQSKEAARIPTISPTERPILCATRKRTYPSLLRLGHKATQHQPLPPRPSTPSAVLQTDPQQQNTVPYSGQLLRRVPASFICEYHSAVSSPGVTSSFIAMRRRTHTLPESQFVRPHRRPVRSCQEGRVPGRYLIVGAVV